MMRVWRFQDESLRGQRIGLSEDECLERRANSVPQRMKVCRGERIVSPRGLEFGEVSELGPKG
jgi:hypothetical protein